MEARFTKGPWRTAGSRNRQVFSAEGEVADCACQWADDDDEDGLEEDDLRQQENAKLVSAAPDLYMALFNLMSTVEAGDNDDDFCRAGFAALAKARGEQ